MPVCYRSKGAASHVRSANPFTQLSDGGCTCRHRFPQPTPTPFLVAGHTPFEHPPLSKEIRTSCDLDVGLTGLAWSPGRSPRLMKIFELGWAHTYTHTHTHASGYTFRRLSPEYGNFAIYLINFCLFHIERRMWKINKWRSYGSKRYKSRAQLFHMPHTLPLPRDCNLAKIMLANKNGKRHKRLVPHSPHSISRSLCLYISVYKRISASCTCGTF